jgi:hypothetical protein
MQIAGAHDRSKTRDGWYQENFSVVESSHLQAVNRSKMLVKRRELGINHSDVKEIAQVAPHPTIAGAQYRRPPGLRRIIEERGIGWFGSSEDARAMLAPRVQQLIDLGLASFEPVDIPDELKKRGYDVSGMISLDEFLERRKKFKRE